VEDEKVDLLLKLASKKGAPDKNSQENSTSADTTIEDLVKKLSEAEKAKEAALEKVASLEKDKANKAIETPESTVNFNEQDEALVVVNEMMRKELDQVSNELNITKQKLQEEEETSKKDLDAFSDALKGVDELRQSAEVMSRELQRIKRRKRSPRSKDYGDEFSDEVTVATVATATLDSAKRVLNRHKRSQRENPIWSKLNWLKSSFLAPVQEE